MSTAVGHVATVIHDTWGGPCRWIRVSLHDTTVDLQAAAALYTRELVDDWRGTAGCFHPAPTRERFVDGEWIRRHPGHWAGLMRLARDHLTTEALAHESFHAAAAIYRMDVCDDIRLSSDCGRREEQLAYITGHLVAGVTNLLHTMGAWS